MYDRNRIFGQLAEHSAEYKRGKYRRNWSILLTIWSLLLIYFWYLNWFCNLNCKRNMMKKFSSSLVTLLRKNSQLNRHYFRPNIRPKVSADVAEYSVSAETRFSSFGRTLFVTQRGNYENLLALRFCVKSKLLNLKCKNLPFSKDLNFDFCEFSNFLKVDIFHISKI